MQLRNPNMTGYEGDEALFASVGNNRLHHWQQISALKWRRAEGGMMAVQVTITTDNREIRFNNMENKTTIKEVYRHE